MKRFLFALLIMTFSESRAEWELVGENDFFSFFVDKETIRKKDNFLEVWSMRDFLEAQVNASGKIYRSEKILQRIDCLNETVGIISLVQYAADYGKSEVIVSVNLKKNEIQDVPIVPRSVDGRVFKITCGSK